MCKRHFMQSLSEFASGMSAATSFAIADASNVLDYDVLNLEVPTLPVVGSLIKAGVRVLIYSGDQDSVIPLTGSRTLVQKLGRQLGLNTTVPYRVWFEGQQ
ncbi:serine carboxypeptidase-like 45-like, partial [Trifolium medium]|nr:serine carboxypeptidase-like 45-like [Trifolium medium]